MSDKAASYGVKTYTLAAGEVREVVAPTRYLCLVSATDEANVKVALDASADFQPLYVGLNVELQETAPKVWLRNDSGLANVISLALGVGSVRDNRVAGASAAAVNVTKIAGASAVGQKVAANSVSVVLASNENNVTVVGKAAHDAAVSGAPVLVGAEARATERAAVASGDAVRLASDLAGKLIVLPYSNPENFTRGKTAALTDANDHDVIAAPAAERLYITSVVITNDHATVGTEVVLKDGATEIFRVYMPALNATAGPASLCVTFPVPLRLTAATALKAANVTNGSNTYVAAVGYTGA